MTWEMAIQKILRESPVPLHYAEITEKILSGGLRKNAGATPSATVNAQIASSIKHEGATSPYVRAGKGVFTLRKNFAGGNAKKSGASPSAADDTDSEETGDIITSFGMFWQRDAVKWSQTPRLLGLQGKGADAVDFCEQRGIYLLYDGREVIYVGRATERSLGRRLYEHTMDRHATRWDRFS
jgi:hypothetical protein